MGSKLNNLLKIRAEELKKLNSTLLEYLLTEKACRDSSKKSLDLDGGKLEVGRDHLKAELPRVFESFFPTIKRQQDEFVANLKDYPTDENEEWTIIREEANLISIARNLKNHVEKQVSAISKVHVGSTPATRLLTIMYVQEIFIDELFQSWMSMDASCRKALEQMKTDLDKEVGKLHDISGLEKKHFISYQTSVESILSITANKLKEDRSLWYKLSPLFRGFLGIVAIIVFPVAIITAFTKSGYSNIFWNSPMSEFNRKSKQFCKESNEIMKSGLAKDW